MRNEKSSSVYAALAAALAASATALVPSAASGYTSASYERDGLIAQWDAIDNAGAGVHDPGATVWKDLAGNYDLALLPNGGWSADGKSLAVHGASAVCSNSLPAYKTIEVVYRMTNPAGNILFASGGTSQVNEFRFILFNRYRDGVYDKSGTNGYFSGAWKVPAPHVVWDSFDPSAVRSMAATYNNGEANAENGNVNAVYADGAVRCDGSADTAWGLGDGHIMIGDRTEAGAYPWYGEVYTIRVYDRALDADEIAANHAIDMARFCAPAADEDYIFDGLVARWDGIDNAGAGVHDPGATVWKDLAGNLDLALTGAASWTNGNALLLASGGYAFNDARTPEYKTIEVVFKMTDVNGRMLFNSGGDADRIVGFDGVQDGTARTAKVYFTSCETPTPCIDETCHYEETRFLAARYGDDGAVTELRCDGVPRTDLMYKKETSWDAGEKTTVGCRYTSAQGGYFGYWMGEVYAIRLYGRRLASWELAHNNRIDRRRFLTSGSYVRRGMSHHWDGIDNAGAGVHDSSATAWRDLAGNLDLTVRPSGRWVDDALFGLGTGMAAQSESEHAYFETLEVVFRNWNTGKKAMLFSGGYNINRYCAIGENYTMWTYRQSSPDFSCQNTEPATLTWVSSNKVYENGEAMQFETVEDGWNAGTDTVQVGDRAAGASYPFTGDIHAIRVYWGTQLNAYEIAYNAKVDDARFFTPKGGRAFAWKGPGETLADGALGSNGCWTVSGSRTSREIPTIGDSVYLPSGDYTVEMDETNWSLGSLSVGTGARLKLALPLKKSEAKRALISLSGGIFIADGGALELENLETFCGSNSGRSVTVVECAPGSEDVLNRLAASLRATIPSGKVLVENGRSLVVKSPYGFGLFVK